MCFIKYELHVANQIENNSSEILFWNFCPLLISYCSLEKRVNKKVMAMFEKAEDEYNDLISKKNIIEVSLVKWIITVPRMSVTYAELSM